MIRLVMIVRDEAANLHRNLDAAKPLIDDVFLIDTGSTDGTQARARKWGKAHKVRVTVVEEPWVNFQVNRTSLLERSAKGADWLLMLDADMVIHWPQPLPDLDGADCWHGRVGFAGMDYTLPFLIRSGKPWRYEGVAHAYLACAEEFDEAVMDGLWVEDYSHTTVEKLERDLEALSAEHARNPLHPRTTFYLAQTYYDLDRFAEAVQFYRARAYMDSGWDEEQYYATYRLGMLLCEHFSYSQGAKELLRAWEMRPQRVEALRALAGCTSSVANKIPKPPDRLFVHARDYTAEPPAPVMPPRVSIASAHPKPPKHPRFSDITAIIPTRGNVDMAPCLEMLPYGQVIVWDNSQRDHDLKPFARYAAIPEATRPIIYWQDDDVIFHEHHKLLAAYERGRVICNMDQSWIEGAGYDEIVAMLGAGSLCDATLPEKIFDYYLAEHPWDDDVLVEADFIFGTLSPWKRIDVGYETRPFTDDPDRLYTQPWQQKRKWKIINRCQEMIARDGAMGWPGVAA